MSSRQGSLIAIAAMFLGSCLLDPKIADAQADVWTHHNDNARTGANLAETQLNTSNVNPAQFGKLFQYSIDAAVFAQPLLISNLSIPGKGQRNVVFVATMNNSVYAFDADDPTTDSYQPIWQVNFNNLGAGITPVPSGDISDSINYFGPFGIMGTPVIDQASGTLYLVARSKESGSYFQRLRALDITTGQERPGSGIAISSPNGSAVSFDPRRENQRPALALASGRVYISWASQEDNLPYQGWVMAYSTNTLQQQGAFSAVTSGRQAGIWMSGEGPAVDASGNIYVVTGNGDWDGTSNFAQTVLKLSPSLALLDWFTPDDWQGTSAADADLSSSGVLLIPGTPYTVSGSKAGVLYILNSANLGHILTGNTQVPQVFQGTTIYGQHIHGTPIYWNGPSGPRVYMWAERDFLKAFAFGGSSFNTTPVTKSTFAAPTGMPGGFLSLSANGSTAGTGIVWAAIPLSQDSEQAVVPGVLRAFDATDLTNQLWNSENTCSDEVGAFAKYVPPTIANGKVYLPTFSNQLLVYGLLNTKPSANPGLVGTVRCDSGNVNLTATGTSDWAKWPSYVHKATGGAQISNFAVVGTATTQTATYTRAMTWTDGTPTVSGADQSGVFVTGRGNGFQVSAPADTMARTLYLYVSGNNSAGRLVAHLSDGSAPDYVNALSGAGNYDVVYTLTYKSLSPAQQLIVTWTQGSDPGNVVLRGAALSIVPPVPQPPTGVSATNGTSGTSVTVTWAAAANATNYTVYRSASNGVQGNSIGNTTNTIWTDSTVVPGTVYYYSVVASGVSGSSAPSPQVSGFAAATPPTPTAVSATKGTSATSVTVSWATSLNATNYTVYRSTSSGIQGTSIGTTNTTSLTDFTPIPGTMYFYSVIATGVGGTSAPSVQARGYAGTPPGGTVVAGFQGFAQAAGVAASQTTTTAAAVAAGGSLSGAGVASSATVNLTVTGATDWAKWPNYIHKATGGSQIGTYAVMGTVTAQSYANDPRTLTWGDGLPTATGTDQAGLSISGIGNGFRITAPADTTTRMLSLYVGGSNSGATLIAHLSDGSTLDYVTTTAAVTGSYDLVYTITYRAALAGQQLSLSWIQSSGSGSVRLQGAALK